MIKAKITQLISMRRSKQQLSTICANRSVTSPKASALLQPSTGSRLPGGHSFDEEETAGNCEVINAFAGRLTRVPADARSVLELVVAKGFKAYGPDEEFRIPEPVLKGLADSSLQKLREHAHILDYFGLLYIDTDPVDGGRLNTSFTAPRRPSDGLCYKTFENIWVAIMRY